MTPDLSRPATVSIAWHRKRGLHAEAAITPAALLAIGGLVASILLSTAVLVEVAARGR
ncbi:hypothetical protein [Sphingomonas sp. MA1305]|uniref:hypothetical protein n=1 Tax=Sphingomonas sp. MA1305 TaxID=2479204 RepID=UPI0018DF8748|nr:hypothetical protein [Sphingomonas sp. MA1305]